MSTRKTYWKVISKDRKSLFCLNYPVTYTLNKWAKPRIKNSLLMVFKDKIDAEVFVSSTKRFHPSYVDGTVKIVPCHIKKSRRSIKFLLSFPKDETIKSLIEFWKMDNKHRIAKYMDKGFEDCWFHYGTVFASEVKCLE